jgi:AhpD family alkylhydroperoxidase
MIQEFPAYRKDMQSLIGKLRRQAPAVLAGFGQLHEGAMKPGALDTKQKELIALGIGIGSRCDACIAFHVYEALDNGATHDEIVETIGVGVMMGGGPSLMYGAHALAALEQFEDARKSEQTP